MNREHLLEITLTVRGPVLVKSSQPAGFGLDAAMARVARGPDAEQARIPGTLLKGKLVEALAQLARVDGRLEEFSRTWLGVASDQPGSRNEPDRGRLLFEDLLAVTGEDYPAAGGVRHRIGIDETRGSVEERMLQVIETPFAPGRAVVFKGQARFFADEETAAAVVRCLRAALSWLTQIGANRTVGFGRILGVCVARRPGRQAGSVPPMGAAPIVLELAIRPLGPLCVSKHKIGGNLFESEDFIPGNVLKGAVAETWAALAGGGVHGGVGALQDASRAALTTHFDRLRFRHAFPTLAEVSQRPQVVPHSVVKADCGNHGKYWDLVARGEPVVFTPTNAEGKKAALAPAFRTDWKGADFGALDPRFGWASPAKELRVRTAIDSLRRRADKGQAGRGDEPEGKLFAWEMMHPFTAEGKPVVWRARVDLAGIGEPDRAAVAAQLGGLLGVLSFVSKTKAACEVTVTPVDPAPSVSPESTVAIVLQTPALLCDPRFQNLAGIAPSGALGLEDLHRLYAAVWESREFGGDALELSHFFASQSLMGGEYLHHRFRQGHPYNPWLLTDAGSVFVFAVKDAAKARGILDTWLAYGLPLPEWAVKTWGDSWRANPFLSGNGFGEIAIHTPHPAAPVPPPSLLEELGSIGGGETRVREKAATSGERQTT